MNGDARSARIAAISSIDTPEHSLSNDDDDDDDGLLYTLDFESPFAWPAVPAYAIGRRSAVDNSSTRREGDMHNDAQDAPAASTSNLGMDSMLDSTSNTSRIIDAGDASIADESIHYPDTMQEYYWDCLYCSSKSLKNESATRLIQAFKSEHYKTTTLHSDGTQEIHQNYRDTLSSIIYTKLGKLDKKYHVDLPMIIDDWTRTHEYLENGTLAEDEEEEQGTENGVNEHRDSPVSAEKLVKVKADYGEKELEILESAWEGWMASARDNQGERVVSASEKRNRLRSTVRERLNALETSDLQLQILLALELLCVLPIPSYLTSRNAHHRRLHSASSSISQNWLAILRAGTPQRGSNASRKRKKDQSSNRDLSSTLHSGHVTSSNLTTPRQSSTPFNPSMLSHIESIPEDEQDEEVIIRATLEKLFKETARLLDSQTDNLAIQQTVANAIGGLSLADLMGDTIHSTSINGDEKGKGKEKEEWDGFQSFWLDVVEEHYSTRLPSDILSGCHSKLFSNSLDPSLLHSSSTSNTTTVSTSHPHPSPFHHPTPDLRQLARSVHLANLQAEKMAMPQSPTLVKLLAAKEESKPTLSYLDNNDEDGEGGMEDNVNWLMPAPAPISLGAGSILSNISGDSILHKKSLKSLSRASSGSITNTNSLRHHDMRRIVEFGKVKIVKEKREEIQKNMMSKNNTFKPFNTTSSLVNAHLQSQIQIGVNGENTGRISAMASSIGARNMKNAASSSSSTIQKGDKMDASSRDRGMDPLSSSSIGQTNTVANNGRISKRKAASPKKTTLVIDKSGNHRGRTLVLATPVKIRSTKSASSSSLFGLDHQQRASFKQDSSHDNGDAATTSKSKGFVKSVSLPAFKWGNPALGRGIDEGDEEEMDRGLGGGSDDDNDDEREAGRGKLKGLLLVGETPQKG